MALGSSWHAPVTKDASNSTCYAVAAAAAAAVLSEGEGGNEKVQLISTDVCGLRCKTGLEEKKEEE